MSSSSGGAGAPMMAENTLETAMRETLPFATNEVFIGGRWRAASGGQTLPLANPSDGSTLGRDRARRRGTTSMPRWPRRGPRWTATGAA